MTTHADHDHPNTKAARAACRRGYTGRKPLPPMSAEDKARIKAGGPVRKPKPKAKADPVDHDDERRDGRRGESRLATARAACKHPAKDWVLKGATKKKTGAWYCPCGQHMGDEGPRDLAKLFNFFG